MSDIIPLSLGDDETKMPVSVLNIAFSSLGFCLVGIDQPIPDSWSAHKIILASI